MATIERAEVVRDSVKIIDALVGRTLVAAAHDVLRHVKSIDGEVDEIAELSTTEQLVTLMREPFQVYY